MIGHVINQSIQRDYRIEVKRDYLGCSQMGYCAQKLLYQLNNSEKPSFDNDLLLRFLTGNAMHEKLLTLLWKHRKDFRDFVYKKGEKQVDIIWGNDYFSTKEYHLQGHADLVFTYEKSEYVCDFKIVSDISWKRTVEPSPHHRDQLFLYGHGLGINKLNLCYFNKDTGIPKDFRFCVDSERVSYLLNKYEKIIEGNIEGLPVPEQPWECGYCEYKEKCQECISKGYVKKDESMELDPEMELNFLTIKDEMDKLKEEADELKRCMLAGFEGEKGIGSYFRADYIDAKTSITYPINNLKRYVTEHILKLCEKTRQVSGYYKLVPIRRKKEKKHE